MVLKGPVRKAYVHQDLKGLIPIYYSILFCSNVFSSTSQHSIISEKSWMLISSTVRTSAVGLLFFPLSKSDIFHLMTTKKRTYH